MKNSRQNLVLLMALLIFQGCTMGSDNGPQSIEVSRTNLNYRFKAQFPEAKSNKVFSYVERELKIGKLFKKDIDTIIRLTNGAKFDLTSGKRKIEIEFTKKDNTETSWKQLEQLCMGIKGELK